MQVHSLLGGMLALAATLCAATASAGEPPAAMAIDRLYSLPRITGTAPEAPVWSPDGRYLAFLWNEEGYPFRDLWVYDVKGGRLARLTDLGGERAQDEHARGVTEARWMASGESIAFAYRGDLYAVTLEGGAPQALTRSDARESRPRPAPESARLAFLREGDLWAKDTAAAGSEARRLLRTDSNKIAVERFRWSPDGGKLAVVVADNTDVPVREIHYYEGGEHKLRRLSRPFPGDPTTQRRIAIIEADGGAPRWLDHPPEHPIYGFAWSAAGDALMVDSSSFMLEHRNIRVYDAATGAGELHYSFHEPRQLNPAWSAAWAPGDEGLIILSDRNGWYHLYHQAAPGGALRRLTGGEWEVAGFTVDAANRQIYFTANKAHRAERQIYRVPFAGGEVMRISRRPGTHEAVFAPDFRHAADRFSDDVTPPDLYLHALGAVEGAASPITQSPRPGFAELDLADVRYIRFSSHIDGTELIGRLSLPPDFDAEKRYPLIVGSVYANSVRNQWGGRTAHPTWGLDQALVSRGYILLNVNVRGSWGQGKVFRQGLLSGYGGIDIEDLESGVRHLIERGFVDPERVGIWGSSYGGLMTLMSLFKKPELYAAGIAGAPATNVWHAFPEQMWVLGEPVGDYRDRYERQSAYYQSEGLEDPVMIIHGSADAVVLYADSLKLAERMIGQGKLFELVTLPGGSHAWDVDSLAQARFAFEKMIAFFDRHLRP